MPKIEKIRKAVRARIDIYHRKMQTKKHREFYKDAYFSFKFLLRKVDTDCDKVRLVIRDIILDDGFGILFNPETVKISDYVRSFFPEMIFLSDKSDIVF